ncbi:MAG: (2Fe-2S) ferredoxin domain-containing protein [Oscillospiraceae bacterium]|jgi:NADP-reducing hydrogenase subunit HndB|nr:(2Fe-2S) ferredoxin domain-containing protein [Oscillospiraceae bacterium]
MAIKTLEELQKIREDNKSRVHLRHGEDYKGDQIQILVGMGTCGIAVGARETLSAFLDELAKQQVDNVKVVPVGCIGYCQMEPIVMIHIPDEKPCAYGKVTKDKVAGIVQNHIIGNKPLREMMIDVDFERI